jgi:hypothetical protein
VEDVVGVGQDALLMGHLTLSLDKVLGIEDGCHAQCSLV